MGGSSWSNDAYADRTTLRTNTGTPVFAYDAAIKSGKTATKVNDRLDPKSIKGKRESRDSDAHPSSNAIVVSLDVTGSMAAVVGEIHSKLPTLMGLLTRKNYITDPQVLFLAVGDATCDRVPLQVGQFESGLEMDDDLSNMYLEQGGGGQQTESYELAAYFGARKTSIDCFEKRGKKGYFFFIGDENAYNSVDKEEVKALYGDTLEASIKTKDMFEELKKTYNVFFILPEDASNGDDDSIVKKWKTLVGAEHVLRLPKAEAVAELIALQVGLCEGTTDLDSAEEDLKDNGSSSALVKLVKDSVSGAYTGGSLAKTSGTVPGGKSTITRL